MPHSDTKRSPDRQLEAPHQRGGRVKLRKRQRPREPRQHEQDVDHGAHVEADGHGHPDKSPRSTEERSGPPRAEVSNYEIVRH
jgi:hypothetical protein